MTTNDDIDALSRLIRDRPADTRSVAVEYGLAERIYVALVDAYRPVNDDIADYLGGVPTPRQIDRAVAEVTAGVADTRPVDVNSAVVSWVVDQLSRQAAANGNNATLISRQRVAERINRDRISRR